MSTAVLIVDDDPVQRRLTEAAVRRFGFEARVAENGADGLARLRAEGADVVLLDMVMPGLDGFETCRRLKAKPHLASVPVIFMTGLSETEHIVRGLDAGGVDYVTKPIVPDELLARIRTHLAGARSARSARTALDAMGRTLLAVSADGHQDKENKGVLVYADVAPYNS